MEDYVRKITEMLKKLIVNLDEKLNELNYKKELLEKVSRFIAYTNGDVRQVGIYADQELINSHLENIDYNKEDYKACCYLLKTEDENIKRLPQYVEATAYLIDILEYFKKLKVDLTSEIQVLDEECQKKRIEKKYYEMFSEDKICISDISEYEQFLDNHDIDIEDKTNLLILAIKKNVERYQKELRGIS